MLVVAFFAVPLWLVFFPPRLLQKYSILQFYKSNLLQYNSTEVIYFSGGTRFSQFPFIAISSSTSPSFSQRSETNQDLTLELLAIDYLKNKENFEINLIFKDNAHIALSTELIDITLEDQTETYKNEDIR